ncbi:hypothetical protein O181_034227 [Austropuccinia psidii MF-1]|uniref:Uncharacterized protein n=1 Tax=Austropuccinia psidii MF-1 TaxID=1389203 RepID=A0A9Q3D2U4_9BASI|nr:hypothetical protein [Austropuccinia psidii MF-1]
MIQNLEDLVRGVCDYGLDVKDYDGYTHKWCTLIPVLELACKISLLACTNQTPSILEKGCDVRLPQDSLSHDLVEIHPTATIFKGIIDKAIKHKVS